MGLGDQPLRPLTRLRSSLGYFLGRALTHSPVSSEPPSIRGRFTPVVPNPGGAMTPAGLSARLTTLSEHEDTRKSAPVASACHVGTRASHRGRGARDGRAAGALSATAAPGCSAVHDPHGATRGRAYGQARYAPDRAICNTECRRRDEGVGGARSHPHQPQAARVFCPARFVPLTFSGEGISWETRPRVAHGVISTGVVVKVSALSARCCSITGERPVRTRSWSHRSDTPWPSNSSSSRG